MEVQAAALGFPAVVLKRTQTGGHALGRAVDVSTGSCLGAL